MEINRIKKHTDETIVMNEAAEFKSRIQVEPLLENEINLTLLTLLNSTLVIAEVVTGERYQSLLHKDSKDIRRSQIVGDKFRALQQVDNIGGVCTPKSTAAVHHVVSVLRLSSDVTRLSIINFRSTPVQFRKDIPAENFNSVIYLLVDIHKFRLTRVISIIPVVVAL